MSLATGSTVPAETFDVVVVGGGIAGLSAALAAVDEGAQFRRPSPVRSCPRAEPGEGQVSQGRALIDREVERATRRR